MFGYGSLMSKTFIESGLLEKDYKGPFLPAHLKNYRRSWTFAWPSFLPSLNPDGRYYKDYLLVAGDTLYPQNLVYLNIREEPNATINGVLYVVPEADLHEYDDWELGYERFEVTDFITDFTIEGGPVFAYKALPGFTLEPDGDISRNVIDLSYWKIIQEAFDYWGEGFEAEYLNSTEPVDTTIIRATQKILWKDPLPGQIGELKSLFKNPAR